MFELLYEVLIVIGEAVLIFGLSVLVIFFFLLVKKVITNKE